MSLDADWMHIPIWRFDTLECTRYSTRLLINLKSVFLELDTQVDGLPSSQVCILMEDGDHWTMLHWYYTDCSYNLEISDLVIMTP